jgi:hypothetical protein
VYGLKHQKEKRSMDHFAGLDVLNAHIVANFFMLFSDAMG